MYVAFALLADAANVSADGKLNILGVFDAVRVASFPAVHPRAHLVVKLKALVGDAGTHRLEIRYLGPGGASLLDLTAHVDVPAMPAGASEMDLPLVLPLDLRFEQAGAHAITLTLDGRVIAQLPLAVVAQGPTVATPLFEPPSGALVS